MAKASEEDKNRDDAELAGHLKTLEKGYLPAALSGDEELPIWYDEDEDGDRRSTRGDSAEVTGV